MDKCPYCNSTDILWDYFDDEFTHWCGCCGRDITNDIMYEKEGDGYDYYENWEEDAFPRVEGEPEPHGISSMGRD